MARARFPLFTLGIAAFLSGCGSSPQPSTSTGARAVPPPGPAPGQFLQVDAARRAVDLTLIGADGSANNGFNFDGYGRGELIVSVPTGWRVTVHCRNAGSLRNSCSVVQGAMSAAIAFPGATTPNPVTGLGSGQSAVFSFTPTRTGTFRLVSLVPGHAAARMWDVLEITRLGRPTISARPRA